MVIGGGSWGAALAHQLRTNPQLSYEILVRSPASAERLMAGQISQLAEISPRLGFAVTTDRSCLSKADYIYLAVPVSAHKEMFELIAENTENHVPIILCAKGLVSDKIKGGLFLNEYAAQSLPKRPVAVLSGPSFADEVLLDLPTALLAASTDANLRAEIAQHFDHSPLRIYQGGDPTGASLGGSAKNVIAIAAGICAGKKLGDNARAGLITRGLAETVRLAGILGADKQTISGLAGIGDLVLSCANTHSRNMAYGYALGAGAPTSTRLAEGRHSAATLIARAKYEQVDLPICRAVDQIINHGMDITQTIALLLARQAGEEQT